MEENDDYKELGPEYRMTPLPSRTGQGSSTLLEEDAPLGEGRDEFGNDVSAKRNQVLCVRTSCIFRLRPFVSFRYITTNQTIIEYLVPQSGVRLLFRA